MNIEKPRSRARPVRVGDVIYPSARAAARAHGITAPQVAWRITHGKNFPDWSYVD